MVSTGVSTGQSGDRRVRRTQATLQTALMELIQKQDLPHITVADDVTKADFIVSGTGETYIKGYLGTNPRVRYLNSEAQPVYGGYLSVELKNPEHETVWSYLVTPRRFGPEDVNRNLAGQIVNRLAQEIAVERKAAKP